MSINLQFPLLLLLLAAVVGLPVDLGPEELVDPGLLRLLLLRLLPAGAPVANCLLTRPSWAGDIGHARHELVWWGCSVTHSPLGW